MGTKYTTTPTSGYNASPPADDGTTTDANKVKWATVKDKLTDILKTRGDSADTKLIEHFDVGPIAKTAAYTVTTADYQKTIECDGTFTVTLGAVATLGAGFFVHIKNTGTGTITVDGNAAETIDGSASHTLAEGDAMTVQVDSVGAEWIIVTQRDKALTEGFTGNANDLNLLSGQAAGGLTANDLSILSGAAAGGLTAAELLFINTLTSNAQTQLNNKQPLDADLTAIAAVANTSGFVISGTGSGWTSALATNSNISTTAGILVSKLANYAAGNYIEAKVGQYDDTNAGASKNIKSKFICPRSGTVTTRLGATVQTSAHNYFVQVYKNGVAEGTNRTASTTAGTWTWWNENITVSAGDTLEVWTSSGGSGTDDGFFYFAIMCNNPTVAAPDYNNEVEFNL